jgi:hypothetical protein
LIGPADANEVVIMDEDDVDGTETFVTVELDEGPVSEIGMVEGKIGPDTADMGTIGPVRMDSIEMNYRFISLINQTSMRWIDRLSWKSTRNEIRWNETK